MSNNVEHGILVSKTKELRNCDQHINTLVNIDTGFTQYECEPPINNQALLCNSQAPEIPALLRNRYLKSGAKGSGGIIRYRFELPADTSQLQREGVQQTCKIYDCQWGTWINGITPQWAWDLVKLHDLVWKKGYPNIYGARIEIESKWNLKLLDFLLQDYVDWEVVEFLKYGWPANRVPGVPNPTVNNVNHKSASEFSTDIDKYITKELRLGAVMGPFRDIPFSGARIGVSPLSTRAKKESIERRVILDLSYPDGKSVNDYTPKDTYLGLQIDLTYPSVDDLARHIAQVGRKTYVWKKDLSRAFRQYPLDPGDYELFGYIWRGYYFFDMVLVMGHRVAPYIAQRISNALRYIMQQMQYHMLNYVDDFVGAEIKDIATKAYNAFGDLLRNLGVSESLAKSVEPTQIIQFLGVTFRVHTMTMEVSESRLLELNQELTDWNNKSVFLRVELEQLIGKLQFITACVRPGRIFLSRLLNALRGCQRGVKYSVSSEMRKDIEWWKTYMPKYNGVSIMWPTVITEPDSVISTDASLGALGGYNKNNAYFHVRLSAEWKNKNIAYLEMWALILALKVWGASLRGTKITMLCDNQSVVSVLTYGRSRDIFLQDGMREVAYLCAVHECEIKLQYIPTHVNLVADALSRWHIARKRKWFRAYAREKSLKRELISTRDMVFSHNW